ncbi:MAG: DUF87 domain-containing protein, partial [Cyanobacteria bacterium P01_A01_bin.17]
MKTQRSEVTAIGTVKGPGEHGNQYVFITADTEHIKIGEFVFYRLAQVGDQNLDILGKISACTLVDHLPDRMFADTEIDPSTIAALIGFKHASPELYEVAVEVVGYFHQNLGFMNPRQPPEPGARVYMADDVTLRHILNKKQSGEVGSAAIGSLLLRQENAVPISLDVKELVSTHMAILAGTGSGKSYTAGVLIEELLLPHNRAAVLIFDPHGEYG